MGAIGGPELANPATCPHPDEALALGVATHISRGPWAGIIHPEIMKHYTKPMCTLCGKRWGVVSFERFLFQRAFPKQRPCSPNGPACVAPKGQRP